MLSSFTVIVPKNVGFVPNLYLPTIGERFTDTWAFSLTQDEPIVERDRRTAANPTDSVSMRGLQRFTNRLETKTDSSCKVLNAAKVCVRKESNCLQVYL